MPNTKPRSVQDSLEAEVGSFAPLEWDMSPAIPQIIQAILTAKAYDANVLIQSHLNAIFEASRNLVHDLLQQQLGKAQIARNYWQNVRVTLAESPRENYDDLGKKLESFFKTLIDGPISLRDGPIRMLEQAGYEVAGAALLRREIEELQNLTEEILRNWPWSSKPLPAVDRKMVAESRVAIVRKEGEGIEDLIRRLGGTPAKFD